MKTLSAIRFTAIAVICLSNASFAQTAQAVADVKPLNGYKNPGIALGDPYVLLDDDGMYYMYGTGGRSGYPAYSSRDLVNWKSEGQVYTMDSNSWGNGAFWAPEVYKVSGKYYMFYSAQWKVNPTNELENFRIGVAVSDKPTGPFVNISDKPIYDPGYPAIDADVFFDTDGKAYLYYSRCCYKHPVESEVASWAKKQGWYEDVEESWVYGIQIKPDFSGVIGDPVLLLRPPVNMNDQQAEWESRSVTSHEIHRRWTEGSTTFKHGDTYYITYSANNFAGGNYAVGYATSKTPLGPFVKAANNPILQKNTPTGGIVDGTGHNCITYSPDRKEMFIVYHARTKATGQRRMIFIDRMEILPDGKLVVHGPTTDLQPLPSGVAAK